MTQQQTSNTTTSLQHLLTFYRTTFIDALVSPACWLFIAIYLLALLLYLPAGGNIAGLRLYFSFHVFYLLVIIIILPLTTHAPMAPWQAQVAYSRRKLWWQVIFALLIVVLSIAYDFWLFDIFAPQRSLWEQHYRLLATLIPWLTPLLLFCLLPLIIMRMLGVPWSELGFGRGYRSWLISGICSLIVLCITFLIGPPTLAGFLANLIQRFLQAGFPEEVFFRGILLTRLIRLFGTKWGIVLSTLIFGIMHMALNLSNGGSILLALCEAILSQATTGIIFAIIFVRTRNILAGVVFHTLLDAIQ
jgi:membrane protease YdiL (CAAX protease family)